MQDQSENERHHKEQGYGKGNQSTKYFSLSKISKRLRVSACRLVAKKAIGDPAIKRVRTQGYHQSGQFDASNQVPVQETAERAQQKSCQRCHPDIYSHVMQQTHE